MIMSKLVASHTCYICKNKLPQKICATRYGKFYLPEPVMLKRRPCKLQTADCADWMLFFLLVP